MVSIIIRTKNEERWISACLRSVFSQTYNNLEVIIVDNQSEDKTLRRASEFPVKVVSIENFLPGLAINKGIRQSQGKLLVCLSGHCIPRSDKWLENLLEHLSDPSVGGVYGRQEPMSYSSALNKRDLITVFGLDRIIQHKDPFFHNANSAFRREIWEKYPFNEQITNIEDRLWGKTIIEAGMKIVYEPDASVYHHHGIHHDLDPERARRIINIIEAIDGSQTKEAFENLDNLHVVAVIPVRGASKQLNQKALLGYSIKAAQGSRYVREIIVATDNTETADLARLFGARAPFLRPKSLSEPHVDINEVLSFVLDKLEAEAKIPDLIVSLEETYPFRTPNTLDVMIEKLVKNGFDSMIAARNEDRGIFLENNGETSLVGDGFMPRNFKQTRAIIGLLGFGCVLRPSVLRQGNLLGGRIGIHFVDNYLASLEVRDKWSIDFAERIIDDWCETWPQSN